MSQKQIRKSKKYLANLEKLSKKELNKTIKTIQNGFRRKRQTSIDNNR
jgi:hypothetical protein